MSDLELLKSTLARTPECLSAEQLESLTSDRAQVSNHPHLSQCARCQAELALLKSFETATPLPNEGAAVAWIGAHLERQLDSIKGGTGSSGLQPVQPLRAQGSWFSMILGLPAMRWAIPLTALAALVVMSAVLLRSPKEPQLQASAERQGAIYRSQEIELVSPLGDVEQVPRELRWQVFESAVAYQLALMEVDHSVLWSSETKTSSVEIPMPIRAKMLPGKPILWQVKALGQQGQILASSQVQQFVVPRKQSSQNPR